MLSPTPYPDINELLLDFAARTRSILGSQFLAFYLYGSLALGDFNPDTSDIDWIVVTRGEISTDIFTALREIHVRFDQSDSPWAGKIEAAYIPLETLNQPAPTSAFYPQLEKGTELFQPPLESGWVFQRYTLRERGVVVTGPAPRTLIGPVDPAEMRRTTAAIATGWLDQSRQDPSWNVWVRQRANLSFVVLTLCRLLHNLETGSVVSKPAAARWARENLGERWDLLILGSLAGQQDHQETSEFELVEMLALLSYTVERGQQVGFR